MKDRPPTAEHGFIDELLSSENEGVVLCDTEHRVIQVNHRFLSMFGYSEEAVVRKSIDALIVPPQLAVEASEISRTVSTGNAVSMETVRMSSDGTPIPVSVIASLLTNTGGECLNYAIYRQLADQAGRRRRKGEASDPGFLTDLFEDADEPGLFTDAHGRISSINHSFSRHFGWKPEELAGKKVGSVLVPDEMASREESTLSRTASGAIFRTEAVLLDAYGTRRRASLVAVPVSLQDGSIGSYRGYSPIDLPSADLLDAKGKNRFQQPPFRHLPGVFFRVRNDDIRTIEFISRPALTAPGSGAGDRFSLKDGLSSSVHPDDREILKASLQASLDTGAPYQSTYRIITSMGEKWVLEQGSPVDDNRNFEGYLVDITASKRVEEMVARARKRLEDLHAVASRLQRCATESEIHRICSEAACSLLDADCGMVAYRFNDTIVVSSRAGVPRVACRENCHVELAKIVLEAGGQFSFSSSDPHITECPLAANGVCRPLGDSAVFIALSSRGDAFTESLVGITDLLLGYAEQSLRRIALQRRLIDQAIHDPLTGVYNRNHFNRLVELEESRARRDGTTLGFIMVDIDNFKTINDTRGHQTGDTVLREVAAVLGRAVRRTDTVIRYGGDEFLIILSRVDSMTEMVESRIRKMLLKEVFPGFMVTVSMGHSQWNAELDSSIGEAISRADEMMYREKQNRAAGQTPT